MSQLQNKVALVSGGARGIGGAAATALCEAGAAVVIGDMLAEVGEARPRIGRRRSNAREQNMAGWIFCSTLRGFRFPRPSRMRPRRISGIFSIST